MVGQSALFGNRRTNQKLTEQRLLTPAQLTAANVLYVWSQDTFYYVNNGLLLLHTKDGGPRTIHLRSGRNISLTVPPSSTYLIDSQTGDVLMK